MSTYKFVAIRQWIENDVRNLVMDETYARSLWDKLEVMAARSPNVRLQKALSRHASRYNISNANKVNVSLIVSLLHS